MYRKISKISSVPWGREAICVCFVIFIVLLPELLPILYLPEGKVWTPINSLNYIASDDPAYATTTARISESLPLANQLDYFRLVPYLLAASPAIFFSDFRFIYLVSYILFIGLIYTFMRTISVALGISSSCRGLSFCIFIFYFIVWEVLASAPGVYRSPYEFTLFFDGFVHTFWVGIAKLSDNSPIGSSSLLRYLTVSSSAVLLLGYFAALVKVYLDSSMRRFVALLIGSLFMLFTYPSHTIICYLMLAFLTAMSVLQKRSREALSLGGVGLLTLLFIFLTDYTGQLKDLMAGQVAVGQVFDEYWSIKSVSFDQLLASIFFNKYLFLLCVFLSPIVRRRQAKEIGAMVCLLGVLCSVVFPLLFSEIFYSRFLGRGIDIPVFLMFSYLLAEILFNSLGKQRYDRCYLSIQLA